MENTQNEYHVSFFKPVTPRARKNRNMIVWLVLIWAISIFGFQIALRLLGKPTPEPALTEFNSVWKNVKADDASADELKIFSSSVLQGLGKVYIKPEYKTAMINAFSWSIFKLAGENIEELCEIKQTFQESEAASENILDPEYVAARQTLENYVADMLNISKSDPRRVVIPFMINLDYQEDFSQENKKLTAQGMRLYLTHNRSFLTDFTFLGFPFHYFYTAVFLLVLFIGLCWIYCIQTDKIEKKEQQVA